ncbi:MULTISPECIES: hypothetical protein [unclassified Pseudomonas]|uniref:hypothetical protein n=1 Tax=unclassified Pseudomonas TaxID=196821 RepID=UPI0029585712|nr:MULTISPECIES: hypothetical protein [unclassified Pseudomonas]
MNVLLVVDAMFFHHPLRSGLNMLATSSVNFSMPGAAFFGCFLLSLPALSDGLLRQLLLFCSPSGVTCEGLARAQGIGAITGGDQGLIALIASHCFVKEVSAMNQRLKAHSEFIIWIRQ